MRGRLIVMRTPADFEECVVESFLSVVFSFCQRALAGALSESQSHWVCCNKLASLPSLPTWELEVGAFSGPGQEEEGWLPCGVDTFCGRSRNGSWW